MYLNLLRLSTLLQSDLILNDLTAYVSISLVFNLTSGVFITNMYNSADLQITTSICGFSKWHNKIVVNIHSVLNIEEPRNSVVNSFENMLIDDSSSHESAKLDTIAKCFSLSEVANHGDASDCWIIIYDRVYRITDFLDQVRHFN